MEELLQKCPKCSKTFPDSNDLEVPLFSCKPPKNEYIADREAKEKRNKKFNIIETSKGKFYPCHHCTMVFRLPCARSTHMKRVHEKRRPHKCDTCDHAFYRPNDLIRHMRTHTGEKPYNCHVCDKGFALPTTLKNHVQEHLEEQHEVFLENGQKKRYNCSACPEDFADSNALEGHLILLSSKSETKRDSPEGKEALNRKFNIIETSKGKFYPCLHCNKVFTGPTARSTHTRRIHTESKPHKCETCARAFYASKDLSVHQRTHTGEKPYSCHYCAVRFSVGSSLRRHVKSVHLNPDEKGSLIQPGAPICEVQGHNIQPRPKEKGVKTNLIPQKSTEGSEMTVKSEMETCFTCELCPHPKYFNDVDDLEAHLTSCHHIESENGMDKFNNCGYTGQEFNHEQTDDGGKEGGIEDIKAELIPEETRAETGEKQSFEDSCKSQNRGYSGYKNVQEKLNTKFSIIETSKGKFYPCHYCTKAFTGSTTRSTHTRRIHEKSRPHKCETCGRAFYNPRELTSHKRTHTGEKPFNCHLCESNFTHMRTIHPNLDAISCHVEAENGVDESSEPVNYELRSCSTDRNATLKRYRETTDRKVKREEMVVLPRFGFILDGKMLFAKARHKRKEGTRNYFCKKCRSNFRSDEELCVHYSRDHKLPTIVIQKL